MTNFDMDVEKRLDTAIDHAVPDVLREILERCDMEQTAEIIPVAAAKKTRPWAKRALSLAAACALVIGMAFGFSRYQAAYAVESVVTLGEGENAVELELNSRDEVIGVKPGAGANEAVDGLKLEGMGIADAAEELIAAMGEHGMMSEGSSGSVAVEGKNSEKLAELETLVTSAVAKAVARAAENAGNAAGEAVDALADGDIGAALDKAGEAVGGAVGEAGEIVGEALDGVGGAVAGAGDVAEEALSGAGGVISAVTDGIGGLLESLGGLLGGKTK